MRTTGPTIGHENYGGCNFCTRALTGKTVLIASLDESRHGAMSICPTCRAELLTELGGDPGTVAELRERLLRLLQCSEGLAIRAFGPDALATIATNDTHPITAARAVLAKTEAAK